MSASAHTHAHMSPRPHTHHVHPLPTYAHYMHSWWTTPSPWTPAQPPWLRGSSPLAFLSSCSSCRWVATSTSFPLCALPSSKWCTERRLTLRRAAHQRRCHCLLADSCCGSHLCLGCSVFKGAQRWMDKRESR